MARMKNYETVSYTHLDVYKRQAYNSADAAMIIGKKSTEIEEILGLSLIHI